VQDIEAVRRRVNRSAPQASVTPWPSLPHPPGHVPSASIRRWRRRSSLVSLRTGAGAKSRGIGRGRGVHRDRGGASGTARV